MEERRNAMEKIKAMSPDMEKVTAMSVDREYSDNVSLYLSTGESEQTLIFEPKYAMKLWRCLSGEKETADIKVSMWISRVECDVRLTYVDDGFNWVFETPKGKWWIDADQALALSWAINTTVTSLTIVPKWPVRRGAGKVYVLSARRMLTGDCAENGVEQIGGTEMVFNDERTARDRVREFMRPLVNESFGEAYWEERNVDDVLDDIFAAADAIYNPKEPTVWVCEGQKQSFEVELSERAVLT